MNLQLQIHKNLILMFVFLFFSVAYSQVPSEPTNLVVTPINTGGMIQFTAPSSIGGAAITNYEYSINNGEWVTPSPAITASPLIISGLTNCTTYQVKLRAVNAVGTSNASEATLLTPLFSNSAGIDWISRATTPANNNWLSVTYGNGLFVAVASTGSGNRVMTSPDGITWTLRTSATDSNSWRSVTYGNGLFVAVSGSGISNRVMTSSDGVTWTSRTSAVDNSWESITYGNGLFVAVASTGTDNRVMTSADGIIWTARTSAANNNWFGVTYGNGLFVAIAQTGSGNRVMTSPDGISWTIQTSVADNQWRSVVYGNGLFVAVAASGAGNRVMTSPNGITWTIRSSATDNQWRSVVYGNGLFVAVAASGTGNRVMTSPDGMNWSARTSAVDNNFNNVAYGNGLFVAVADSSSNGYTMTSGLSPVPETPVISSVSPRNTAALVTFSTISSAFVTPITNYEYSINNGSWIPRNPPSNLSPMRINDLNNGTTYTIKIRAINLAGSSCETTALSVTPSLGTVADAPTGLVITPITTGGMIQFTSPLYDGGSNITNYEYSINNGDWVSSTPAITTSPLIISSGLTNCTSYQIKLRAVNAVGNGAASDLATLTPSGSNFGTDWAVRLSAADQTWTNVTYGNGLFVAVASSGSNNRIMTSPDGISWTSRIPAENFAWTSITFGNDFFVAVANSGTGKRVMTSSDGITWTSRNSAADNNWTSVTYGNGLFVAVADSGTGNRVMTSPDGVLWTLRTSAANNNWQSVTYGNALFVAVAYTGTGNRVMTSPDGINWTSRTSATNNNWWSIAYGNGLFVAVAISGTGNRVMTSPDGFTWTSRTSAADDNWYSVTYGNGLFVAVKSFGTTNFVMTSPDGINWSLKNSAAGNNWKSVTYGNGLFVAVAGSGTGNRVMTSSFSVVADAPVITSATLGTSTSVNFTQSSSALAPAITNYEYSIENGSNWTAVSPAATTSPLTITGLATVPSSIMIRAVNSVGNSCPSQNYLNNYDVTFDANGGSGSMTTQSIAYNDSANLTANAFTRNGYTFAGWATTSGGTVAYANSASYTMGAADATFYAQWEENPQPLEPTKVNCWDTFVFNTETSVWDNTGTQATEPTKVNCWDAFVFNTGTCAWDNMGTQDLEPTKVNCWDTFVFNTGTCAWDNTGTQDSEPTKVNCWDTFVFNTGTCSWDNTGTQAAEPTKVNCWDAFVFNTTSCAWDNTGTQAAEPTKVNSWDNFVFNTTSCSWDNTGTATNTTTIIDSLKDSTLTSLSSVVTCYPVASATSYRFKIVTSGTNAVRYYVSTTNSFNLTKVPGTLYSTPYAISVAVYIARSLKTYGAAYTLTTPTPYTKIQDAQCGQTLTSMASGVVANGLAGATNYRFKVVANGEERILESTSRVFQLTSLVGGALYNTAYTISVAIKYNGLWKDYGTECIVRTPTGLSKIVETQCGNTLATVGSSIVANVIAGVTNYRFKVVANGETRTIETVSRIFQLTSLSGGAFFNTAYTISVATKYNGVWGDYGTACTVRTPTGFTKIQNAQCGKTLAALNTAIYADLAYNATNYRFKVVANGETRIIEKASRTFQLTSLPGGVVNNTIYTISVATKYNGKWGDDYGNECTVTTPNTMTARVAKPVTTAIAKEKVLDEVEILAYPSPFTTNFKLNFISSNTATIAVAVYDMTGRQIENRTVNSSEINNIALGDNYPSGVYNVLVTQGAAIKTLRVIKK